VDHLVIVLIQALAGQVSFPHFFLEASVGIGQLGGAVFDLTFESLQGLLLFSMSVQAPNHFMMAPAASRTGMARTNCQR
jgi:hypothetical protein